MVLRCISITFLVALLLISSRCSLAKSVKRPGVTFGQLIRPIEMGEQMDLNIKIFNLNKTELIESHAEMRIVSDSASLSVFKMVNTSEIKYNRWNGNVHVEAVFIGGAHVLVEILRYNNDELSIERVTNPQKIQITRKSFPTWMYKEYYNIYENSLYLIIRILFGMVLDWHEIGAIFRNPVGIAISFFCNYIFMPLTSYTLGLVIFPDNVQMQFVLLLIGVCLMKGISNLWTVILGGNINLSITMSIMNSLLACGTIPLWTSTLVQNKLPKKELKIQYYYFILNIFLLIFPLLIGCSIQFCIQYCRFPNSKKYLLNVLRCLSLLYTLSITIYAVELVLDLLLPSIFVFTWSYILAGFLLPLFGFTMGSLAALVFGQNHKNRLAIALETTNFNTTIALATSVKLLESYSPRELAILLSNLLYIMTPIPLTIHYIWHQYRKQKGSARITANNKKSVAVPANIYICRC